VGLGVAVGAGVGLGVALGSGVGVAVGVGVGFVVLAPLPLPVDGPLFWLVRLGVEFPLAPPQPAITSKPPTKVVRAN
jgi:hypothetical protein